MFENLKQLWGGLGTAARIALATMAVVVLTAVIGLGWWMSYQPYDVLFADLEPKDESAIVAELERLKIPYQLSDDGRSILVARDEVFKTRLKVMGNGVDLKGTVGFEIFNNTDFGMTEFAQKVNLQRALQGELSRTITSIDEVKNARVHLVMPESNVFRRNASHPKASVTLWTKGEAKLSPEQILGIQRLIAAAVPEMEAASVTVTDQQGVTLSRIVPNEADAETSNAKLDLKKQTEQYLTKKVVEILDHAFGPGQAIVSVDATLSWDQIKVSREDVIPFAQRNGEVAGAIVRQRKVTSTSPAYEAADTRSAGLPVHDVVRPTSGPGTSETEYENGKKVEQIISTPGTIKRLSVGVMLPPQIDQYKVEKLKDVISMAVGLTAGRGDAIAVYSIASGDINARRNVQTDPSVAVSIPGNEPPPIPVAARPPPKLPDLGNLLVLASGVIVLIVFATVVLRRRKSARAAQLSEREREATFEQIQRWLRDGATESVADGGKL